MWTSLLGRILARRWRLPRAQTRGVMCERDLRIEMDDGAVLLADRWVARSARAATADRAGPFLLWPPWDLRSVARPAAGRTGLAGGDTERPRHVWLAGDVQPVRRARGWPGHISLAAWPALARGADRDDRRELPGAR